MKMLKKIKCFLGFHDWLHILTIKKGLRLPHYRVEVDRDVKIKICKNCLKVETKKV